MNAGKLTNAEAILAQLRQNYIEELPDKIAAIEQCILNLSERGNFNELYQRLFRSVHSLKGSAGTYGLHIVSDICHHMEDHIKLLESHELADYAGICTHSLECIDLLRKAHVICATQTNQCKEVEHELARLIRSTRVNKVSCMLVSNSKSITQISQSILVASSLDFSIMDDGYLALGRLIKEQFNILITGLETHGMNGLALIAAVKLTHTKDTLPCILITSNSTLKIGRQVDPDRVVVRDAYFAQHLNAAVVELTQHVLSTSQRHA